MADTSIKTFCAVAPPGNSEIIPVTLSLYGPDTGVQELKWTIVFMYI